MLRHHQKEQGRNECVRSMNVLLVLLSSLDFALTLHPETLRTSLHSASSCGHPLTGRWSLEALDTPAKSVQMHLCRQQGLSVC